MRKKWVLLFMFTVLMAFAAACGGENEETSGGNENKRADAKETETDETLSGTVSIDGSGTVYPLMSAIAEDFMLNEEENVSVEVSRAGTSAGMQKFIQGETDFSNASREIKDEEVTELEANGIESKEFKLALDGLTIVTHPNNDWATEMTEEEIKTLFVTGNIADDDVILWSDIRAEWPDEEINFYGPNENHGTYEFFVEEIIEEQELVQTINLQQEYSTLVSLISEDENAIGFFGYGYYANNTDKLNAVNIDFGNGPVEPSLDTIAEDGDYAPFTRPVFTNIRIDAIQEKPQVKAFAEYVFEKAGEFAGETGFAPLPAEELEESLAFIREIE